MGHFAGSGGTGGVVPAQARRCAGAVYCLGSCFFYPVVSERLPGSVSGAGRWGVGRGFAQRKRVEARYRYGYASSVANTHLVSRLFSASARQCAGACLGSAAPLVSAGTASAGCSSIGLDQRGFSRYTYPSFGGHGVCSPIGRSAGLGAGTQEAGLRHSCPEPDDPGFGERLESDNAPGL